MIRVMGGLILSLALVACSENNSEKKGSGDPTAGKVIAQRDCRACHGLDGKGTAPGIPNLANQRERYLINAMKAYKDRVRTHAALRDLVAQMNEKDANDVAAYYASLASVATGPGNDNSPGSPYDRGKVVAAACAQCHGLDGNATQPGIPTLAGQQPRYFVVAVQEYLIGLRETSPMHGLVRDMSRIDLENVALYFASQNPVLRGAPSVGDPVAGEPLTAVCGGCHGSNGVSTDTATPTVAGQDASYLVNSINAYKGSRKHPGMRRAVANLSDKDIADIVAFYASQKSKPAEDGQKLIDDITQKCNRCHTGNMDNAAMVVPKVHGQDHDYLVMALRAYRDERRGSSMMHNMSLPYSDTVIDSIATYYSRTNAK